MREKKHVISSVLPDSIAEELELEAGDLLLSVNKQPVEDIFDYRYLTNEEYLELEIEKKNGEIWELEIEKEYEEDLGLEFQNGLMDTYRSCANRCMFCFIDQMPPGMRETLYFKDDDSRLSFLQGNYVTLTNMSSHDLDRVIRYHMEPINISFHTMNPELRCQMLHNRFAGEALKKADRLFEAGITMNGQIVLCKGINDGEELEYSLEKLSSYAPILQSVSVVPVGLTKYRENLYPLSAFSKEDAKALLAQVHRWQKKMWKKVGMHFVHASDEWYILAEEPLPAEETYDGYLQLENGVGMLRLLGNEVQKELELHTGDEREKNITIATGKLAAPFIEAFAALVCEKFPKISVDVVPIRNEFFGECITVSGLITGRDLIRQLKERKLGDVILIPCNMLRSGENVFLDDLTVEDAEKALERKILVTDETGADFVNALLSPEEYRSGKRRQMYEQSNRSNCGQTECW